MKRIGLLMGLALASLCCFAQNGNNYPASATAAPTIVPASDAGMDLGSLSARWRNAFFSGTLTWTNGSGTADTGASRCAAGSICFGNGAAADFSGTIKATTVNAVTNLQVGAVVISGTATQGQQLIASSPTAASWQNGAGGFDCVNVTPVTVNANTAADQTLQACTVTAAALNFAGKSLLVQVAGVYSTPAGSTSTINLKAKLCTVSGCGSGTVITLVSITSAALGTIQVTNDPFNLTLNSSTQTTGATAAFEVHGNLVIDTSLLTTAAEGIYADGNTATVGTIDATAQLFLQITGAFSNASASNSMTQRQLIAYTVN